jgi:hypothetical protein
MRTVEAARVPGFSGTAKFMLQYDEPRSLVILVER